MDHPPVEEPKKRSLLMPIAWVLVAMLVSAAAIAGIALGAADSESNGALAAQIASFPLGFVLTGALGGLIVHFGVKRATTLLRVVGPMGCGCLGGCLLVAGTVGFFTLIFPTL